ncbi:MAG: hypothetical protein NAOJABEB_03294 [Steroidobacteraceae bacterium]|nr:hypothetical protein [Steroidobacteraceae bacterium]
MSNEIDTEYVYPPVKQGGQLYSAADVRHERLEHQLAELVARIDALETRARAASEDRGRLSDDLADLARIVRRLGVRLENAIDDVFAHLRDKGD